MSQQGGRPTGHEDDWWGQLYDSTDDTGPTPAPDSLDDRYASAAGAVRDGSGPDAGTADERDRRPGTAVPAPRSRLPETPEAPARSGPQDGAGPSAQDPARGSASRHRAPWEPPPDASEGPATYPPGPKPPGFAERIPDDRQVPPSGSPTSTETPPATGLPASRRRSDVPPPPSAAPPAPSVPPRPADPPDAIAVTAGDGTDSGTRRAVEDWWAAAPSDSETDPAQSPPTAAARTGPGSTQPNPTAEPPDRGRDTGSHQSGPTDPATQQDHDGGLGQAGPTGRPASGQYRDDGPGQAGPTDPATPRDRDGGLGQADPTGRPASGQYRDDGPGQAGPTDPATPQDGDGGLGQAGLTGRPASGQYRDGGPGQAGPTDPATPRDRDGGLGQADPTGRPASGQYRDDGPGQAGPTGPATPRDRDGGLGQADPTGQPASGQYGDDGLGQAGPTDSASGQPREDAPRQVAPTDPVPGQRSEGTPRHPRHGAPTADASPRHRDGAEAAADPDPDPHPAPSPPAPRTATHVDLRTLPPAPVGFVGSGPPTYDAEPTVLPPADPDELDDLVADTVLDGARYGTCTLRAVSVRGDSARFRGEPRRDSLLTARFGTGEQALVLVAMATGARATPGAHRAAAEACHWIGRAVGRSHARLAQDIGAARRGDLKSGLHRLTDRSLGKLRASAAEQGIDPEEYAATLRCLLLPADPDCRIRVFFGVGAGGLFRLRDGEWHDIEPMITDVTGEPVVGFGSLPAETPEGDRLTMDLGIPTPPSPYEPAPQPSREPFRFRASVARPGDTLLMCTGGLAEPLRGEPELCEYLTGRWSGPPPGLAAFLADSQVRAKGYADDRTAAAVWEA
ncbi:protein phosphatase 2C domain-containing protein [Streptomyces sp. NPDC019531]|uniref:protein phosphatase 2C domain-containing protein n=1 Tax=Streptomyces sp. NPDC019531 TaxID=3365062 RepID=UPI00384F5401